MPRILDKAVERIKARGASGNPYAIAVSTLQKSGSLKKGSLEPTKQGTLRGSKSEAWRKAHPPK